MSNMETTQDPAVKSGAEQVAPLVEKQEEQVPVTQQNLDFKTMDDEPEVHSEKLEPWIAERLAREKRKFERERQQRESLEDRLRLYEQQHAQTGFVQPQQPMAPQQQSQDPMAVLKNTVREILNETENERKHREEAERQKAQELEFTTRLKRGFDKYDDFDVVFDRATPITPRMREYLETIPNPDDFTYNLVKYNADKLHSIAKMHPAAQSVQMDELYRTFNKKLKSKSVSNAPSPPQAVDSGNIADKDLSSMSIDDIRSALSKNKRRK